MKVNLEGIENNIKTEILETLEEQFKIYPEIKKRLRFVGITDKEAYNVKDAVCYVSSYGTDLIITDKINDSKEITSFIVSGSPRAYITHECGHLLDKCLQCSGHNCPARTSNSKKYRKGTASLYNKYIMEKSSAVSLYARQSEEEFVAEVYTQMTLKGRDTNKYTEEFALLLDKITEEDFGKLMG